MKSRNASLLGILLLSGTSAFAQESAPRIEVFGEYSYLRFNPTIPQLKNRSFNGGGGGVTFNIHQHFGIKGGFVGDRRTSFNLTTTSPIVTPQEKIPLPPFNIPANLFTHLFA